MKKKRQQAACANRQYISFRAFFLIWAEIKGWTVPAFHLRICDWLEKQGRKKVLKVFRGGSKSTILAVYQAWRLRNNPRWRFIDRGADDGLALKLSMDTKHVIERHPLCRGMITGKAGVEQFWINGNDDARNASVTAYGILSNATGSHADEIINDDTEVPKNIKTPDTRKSLRERLSDEVNIIVPGGSFIYVGTDHTHDSIYDEKIKAGYDALIIPLFEHNTRHEADGKNNVFSFRFPLSKTEDLYVIVGIGKHAKVLEQWEYDLSISDCGGFVRLHDMPQEGIVIDVCSGNPWPERFDRAEIRFRRQECHTLNAWDSQYLLQAKPIHQVRLNPDRFIEYSEQPQILEANNAVSMILKNQIVVMCRAYWDCSLGKPDSDDSSFSVMFQTLDGHMYWHVLDVLAGEVYEQCAAIIRRIIEYQIPGVTIETNGPGGFLPAILRGEMKKKGIQCAITEKHVKENKTKRILDAYEAPLSAGFLHVHGAVLESGLSEQMRDWMPGKMSQPDDLIDAGAGCILNLPVKIGRAVQADGTTEMRSWRPNTESYEVSVES